ncbi:MAG: adenylate cyclase [Afipia felis]|nr:adenylate cyclase [Afipia felis]
MAETSTNAYQPDGQRLSYDITAGALKGNMTTVDFEWRLIHGETYAVSWQEADGSTVVHIDDFGSGRSLSFFTTRSRDFFRLEGKLQPLNHPMGADHSGPDRLLRDIARWMH